MQQNRKTNYRYTPYQRYVMRYHMRGIIGAIRKEVDVKLIAIDKAILNLLWVKYRAKCPDNVIRLSS